MKFNDLYNSIINEAKIDDLLSKIENNHLDDRDRNFIRQSNAKLTNQSKYVQWLIDHLGGIKIYRTVGDLNYFDKNQNRFTIKDIYRYNPQNLADEVDEMKANPTRKELSVDAAKDAPKVFENDKCTVLNIKTKDAAKKYGKGTKWCISANENNQWNNYARKGFNFYFIMIKDSFDKYAIAVNKIGGIVCYNSADNLMLTSDMDSMLDKNKINDEIFEKMPEEKGKFYEAMAAITSGPWIMNEDGTIDTLYGVDFQAAKSIGKEEKFGKIIKDGKLVIRFGKVGGSFKCINMNLTSLEGFPKEILGGINIAENKLTSLEGLPKNVNFLDANHNEISSLEWLNGMTIDNELYLQGNKLTSLEGLEKADIGGKISFAANDLISLNGSPKYVFGLFDVSYNKNLKSLVGGPKEILGNSEFLAMNCDLTSLEGCPKVIKSNGSIHVQSNKNLTSMKGVPETRTLYINDCGLTSLERCPKKIEYLYCHGNNISSLEGIEEIESINVLSIKNNPGNFTKEEIQKVSNGKISNVLN